MQDTTMVQQSLQYYVSALMESIGEASVSTTFAGQNSTANNSTLVNGVANYDECSRKGGGDGGFFSEIGNAISNIAESAACEISSTVSNLVQEVDAARGYLDDSAEESPGQTNATFTNVDVRRSAVCCGSCACACQRCMWVGMCSIVSCPALSCPGLPALPSTLTSHACCSIETRASFIERHTLRSCISITLTSCARTITCQKGTRLCNF